VYRRPIVTRSGDQTALQTGDDVLETVLTKLVKTLAVAALSAAALGGAAALGSNLFESPPKDAADFAERVEAGSTHIDPNRKPIVPPKPTKTSQSATERNPTAAERRYVRTMNAWCVQQESDVAALSPVYGADPLEAYVSLSRRWRARVAALVAPPRLLDEETRYLRTWERLESIVVRLVRANQRGDSVAYLELWDSWVHTAAKQSDAALSMGADRCAGWLLQGATPST
jgi:hypothetical protein